MFMNLEQFLKHLWNQNAPRDHTGWRQVASLTPEQKLKYKGMTNKMQNRHREMDLLMKRIQQMQGEIELDRDEFWNDLYKTHGLPPVGNYDITKDGAILMEPKK
jgi:hypothetical protein